MTLPVAYAMVPHLISLPPAMLLTRTPSALGPAAQNSDFRLKHVLSADCGCSQEVARQLCEMGPLVADEEVVLIGPSESMEADLKAARFRVVRISSEDLKAHLGLEGVPWLVVSDVKGRVLYSGGHAPRRPSPTMPVRTREILERLRHAETFKPFASFGCAVSKELKAKLDPLNIKAKIN